MKFEINLFAGIFALLALLSALSVGGHALWQAGYNSRTADDSKAYAAATLKGTLAQQKADADTMTQLQEALAAETASAHDHDQQLANLRNSASSLERRLHDIQAQSPDAARWLAEPIPPAVLGGVCWATACPGAPPANPGH